jgi:UDP-N-acetylglucosamine--N-acetylmuramyl-(pentapeptide) pyrophosphoryl-undecaprenol N-acetylglucosamine transferase
MKIIITGGHMTPAVAVIDRLKKRNDVKAEIVFVGRKYGLESEKTLSLEYVEVEKRGIRFINLETGRLTGMASLRTFKSIIKIPAGFFRAWKIVEKEKPDLVLSLGGYLALPIAISAYLQHIPIFTHEQTIHPGLGNRVIAFVAQKVFVAFAQSRGFFDQKKTIVTGNPVRESIFKKDNSPFDAVFSKPVIYVTGGSLGSHSINVHIMKILSQLLEKYTVIHQIGDTQEYNDFEKLVEMKNNLSPELQGNYFPKKHFFDEEIGYIYSAASLVVGRAGANTFFELVALKKPAIFIPLPWARGGEQEKHAQIFMKAGTGEVFHQDEESGKLLETVDQMIVNIDRYKKNFDKLNNLKCHNAADTIINHILDRS